MVAQLAHPPREPARGSAGPLIRLPGRAACLAPEPFASHRVGRSASDYVIDSITLSDREVRGECAPSRLIGAACRGPNMIAKVVRDGMFCMPRAAGPQASAGLAVASASGRSVVMADCGVMSDSLPVLHMLNLVVTDMSVSLDFLGVRGRGTT